MRTWRPVSSVTSRSAVASRVSSPSGVPFGSDHVAPSRSRRRRPSTTWRRPSTSRRTTPPAEVARDVGSRSAPFSRAVARRCLPAIREGRGAERTSGSAAATAGRPRARGHGARSRRRGWSGARRAAGSDGPRTTARPGRRGCGAVPHARATSSIQGAWSERRSVSPGRSASGTPRCAPRAHGTAVAPEDGGCESGSDRLRPHTWCASAPGRRSVGKDGSAPRSLERIGCTRHRVDPGRDQVGRLARASSRSRSKGAADSADRSPRATAIASSRRATAR